MPPANQYSFTPPPSTNNYFGANPVNQTSRNKWLLPIIALGIIIVALILIAVSLPGPSYPTRILSPTGLESDRHFAHLEGSKLYAYNGLAFYRTDLDNDNVIEVLGSGKKLPTPSAIHWAGDRGALLNFDSSFYYSEAVEALQAAGKTVTAESKHYTWFYDFQTEELDLVAEFPITTQGAYYDQNAKGFYVVPDFTQLAQFEPENIPFGTTPLYFYSIPTGQDTVVVDDLKVVNLTHMSRCADTTNKVCMIARSSSDPLSQRLYAIDANNAVNELINPGGALFATNDPNLYISTAISPAEDDAGGVDPGEEPARLHDLKTKSVTELGFNIAGSNIVPYFFAPDDYYVLNNPLINDAYSDSEPQNYLASKAGFLGKKDISQINLSTGGGTPYTSGLIGLASYGSDGRVLIPSAKGELLLFSKEPALQFQIKPGSDVVAAANACLGSDASEFFEDEGLVRLYVNDGPNLKRSIAELSDCLIKKDSTLMHGHSYQIAITSQYNGKIISD